MMYIIDCQIPFLAIQLERLRIELSFYSTLDISYSFAHRSIAFTDTNLQSL